MNRSWSVVLLILLAISFTLSCGSSPRQLQNITIAQTTNGQQVQFVATGTFSASPRTVTPLPVDWTMGLMAPPPKQYTYTLSTQPFVFNCASPGLQTTVAFAPPDPSAPSNGSAVHVITAAATFTCP